MSRDARVVRVLTLAGTYRIKVGDVLAENGLEVVLSNAFGVGLARPGPYEHPGVGEEDHADADDDEIEGVGRGVMTKLGSGLLEGLLIGGASAGTHGIYDGDAETNETICEPTEQEGHQWLRKKVARQGPVRAIDR